MKKLLSLLMCGLLLFGCSDKYDDSALRNDLNDLENRVAKLEELCKQMNTNISSLQKIVDALQDNLSISKVEQLSDGYIIHFSDGSTATIKNGKNSGDAPIVGVKQDTDGVYYWTLDGEWLTDEKGNKVKAQGTDGKDGVDGKDGNDGADGKDGVDGKDGNDGADGKDGVDGKDGNDGADGKDGTDGTNGKDGITPQLKIENGRWMLSMDNGKTWTDIGQATGADGKDGADGTDGKDGVDGKDGSNGIFKSVTEDNDNVYFTLEDDSVITIPKSDNSKFAIAFDTTDIAILNGGESKTISYTITNATENTVVKAIAQDGWKVKVNATSTDKGTITITAPDPIVESEILVFANDGSYRTVMASFHCYEKQVMDINIADNSIDVLPEGGVHKIKLTTNVDYTVEIPLSAQSWLSLSPETRALREDTIVFEAAANDGISRYATVALKGSQDNTLQTIIFRQLGTCTEIHVETKGELENVLADYDYANIESLKITGVLNDVDFLFIYHKMPNLKDLDISEVNITALPTKAFYKSTNVEHLILPNTLTTIGTWMFYKSKLKSIVIPASVITIEENAFFSCDSLSSIEIPASVEKIGESAFYGCLSLTTVTFEKGSLLTTIQSKAFDSCIDLISIEIPASVEEIGKSAFLDCLSLTSVIFEKGSKLEYIWGVDNNSYNDIVPGVFERCFALTSIEIPASVKEIGARAFVSCLELSTVTFEKGSQLKYIGNSVFGGSGLTAIEIPMGVTGLGSGVFQDCSSLKTVTFEKGSHLKTINDWEFQRTGLVSIEIPASVELISPYAFGQCFSLTTVIFEKESKLKTIGYSSFHDCTSLISIEIPRNVEAIGETAFYNCSSLASVTFENESQLNRIVGRYKEQHSYGAFENCSALTSIEIPASVETIDAAVFRGCSSLTTVTFEKGSQLKHIGGGVYSKSIIENYYYGAFSELKNLTTVDMSACTQVSEIGAYAFYDDSKLRLFKIGTEIPPTCGESALSGTNPHSVLKVPSGCADAYKAAPHWRTFTNISGLDE